MDRGGGGGGARFSTGSLEPIHRSVSTCSFPHILGDGKGKTRNHIFHSGKEVQNQVRNGCSRSYTAAPVVVVDHSHPSLTLVTQERKIPIVVGE